MSTFTKFAETKNAADFKQIFTQTLAAKVGEALEAKKFEVAQNFFNTEEVEQIDEASDPGKELAKSIASQHKGLKVSSNKVSGGGNEHWIHGKSDPEGVDGYVKIHHDGKQFHLEHEPGGAVGKTTNKSGSAEQISKLAHNLIKGTHSEQIDEASDPGKELAKSIASQHKGLKVSSNKVSGGGNEHWIHGKSDPEGVDGYVKIHHDGKQFHLEHEPGGAVGKTTNKSGSAEQISKLAHNLIKGTHSEQVEECGMSSPILSKKPVWPAASKTVKGIVPKASK